MGAIVHLHARADAPPGHRGWPLASRSACAFFLLGPSSRSNHANGDDRRFVRPAASLRWGAGACATSFMTPNRSARPSVLYTLGNQGYGGAFFASRP